MKSIRGQLTAGLLIGLIALLAAGGAGMVFVAGALLIGEFDAALTAKAGALATLVEVDEDGIEFDFSDEIMPDYERGAAPDYFELWLDDGTVIEASRSLGDGHLPRRAGSIEKPETWNLDLPDGRRGRAIGIRFAPHAEDCEQSEEASHEKREGREGDEARENAEGEGGVGVTLVVARGRTPLDSALRAFLIAAVIGALAVCVGAALLVNYFVRKGLRPLLDVSNEATSIDAASLDRRFAVEGMPEELAPICERLNDLLGRLESAFTRERRFSSDVAHELRTPISELRSLAEVGLDKIDDNEPDADIRAHLQDALDVSAQMERLVATLLEIVRSESGKRCVKKTPVDVARLIDDAWKPFAAQANARGLMCSIEADDTLQITTDAELARAILANLFSNAIAHGARNGAIRCVATVNNDAFEVVIENASNDLTAEDIARMGEPFWQKSDSRTDPDHSGIGLALVLAYARLLEVDVRLELPEAGLFRVTLAFSLTL